MHIVMRKREAISSHKPREQGVAIASTVTGTSRASGFSRFIAYFTTAANLTAGYIAVYAAAIARIAAREIVTRCRLRLSRQAKRRLEERLEEIAHGRRASEQTVIEATVNRDKGTVDARERGSRSEQNKRVPL